MAMGGRILGPTTILLLFASTQGSCSCETDLETLASIDEPVRATLIRTTIAELNPACGGGHGLPICVPQRDDKIETRLIVQAEPDLVVTMRSCTPEEGETAHITADAAGHRVACRAGAGPWWVVFVGSEGRGFRRTVESGFEDELDWSEVPTLEEAILELHDGYGYDFRLLLYQELTARSTELLIDTLVKTASSEPKGFHHQRARGGAWGKTVETLNAEASGLLGEQIVAAWLESQDEPTPLFISRLARHGDLRVREPMAEIRARTREAIASSSYDANDKAALLHSLTAHQPEAAGSLGCSLLEGEGDFSRPLTATALAAVAVGSQDCDALARLLATHACSEALRCGESFCSDEEASQTLETFQAMPSTDLLRWRGIERDGEPRGLYADIPRRRRSTSGRLLLAASQSRSVLPQPCPEPPPDTPGAE